MKKHQNIDQLFQEKLKDLEASPNPQVWNEIASKLKQKKHHVFPVWWMTGGIAAVLILSLFIYPFISTSTITTPVKQKPILIVQPTINKIDTLQKNNVPSPKIEIVSNEKNTIIPLKKNKKTVLNSSNENGLDVSKIAMNLEKEKSTFTNPQKKKKIINKDFDTKSINNTKDSILKDSLILKTKKRDFITELTEKASKKKKEKKKKRWSIAPTFSVISSNSFSNSSSIDANLIPNKPEGKSNYSYGVKIAYQLNEKWTLQSGLHHQKLDYSTKNLTIATNISGNNFMNVDYATTSSNFSISSSKTLNDALLFNGANLLTNKATLIQTYGYIEVPIEATYRFINTQKMSFHFISGISTLFLKENKIEILSSTFSETLGKANNLNSFNISTNLGFDFNYSLHQKLKLTINPMIKVPLKTFSKNSNGFKPYLIGVYTGIKYHF